MLSLFGRRGRWGRRGRPLGDASWTFVSFWLVDAMRLGMNSDYVHWHGASFLLTACGEHCLCGSYIRPLMYCAYVNRYINLWLLRRFFVICWWFFLVISTWRTFDGRFRPSRTLERNPEHQLFSCSARCRLTDNPKKQKTESKIKWIQMTIAFGKVPFRQV